MLNLKAPKSIAFLLFNGCEPLDFAGPLSVFNSLQRMSVRGFSGWNISFCSINDRKVFSQGGMAIQVDIVLSELPFFEDFKPDLLIICGGDDHAVTSISKCSRVLSWLKFLKLNGTHLVTICNGALILLATGIIGESSFTTHWETAEKMKASNPNLNLQPDKLFIHADCFSTSAGVASGIDLALDFICHWFGNETAFFISKSLVLPYKRSGSQRQLNTLLMAQGGVPQISSFLDWLSQNLGQSITPEDMASHIGMSRRSFFRWFRQHTGLSPAFVLKQLRIEYAQILLEQKVSPKIIARRCGFKSVRQFFQLIKRSSDRKIADL